MGLFERVAAAISAKAEASIDEGSPIDPSGTHAVLALDHAAFHDGAWVTLPAGSITIEYQINAISKLNGDAYLDVPFRLTMRTESGDEIDIRIARLRGAFCKGMGDVYTRTSYGKADLPHVGRYHVQASGQVALNCNAHLRFV